MLGTASNWPPSYLDEIASLLTNVPYPHLRPFQRRDSYYGLVVALAELSAAMDWDQAIGYTLTQTTQALNELQSGTQP